MMGQNSWDDLLLEDMRLLIEQEHLDPLSRLMMGLTTRSCYRHWKKTYQQKDRYVDGIGDRHEEVFADPTVRLRRIIRQHLVLHGVPKLAEKWKYKDTFDVINVQWAARHGCLSMLIWIVETHNIEDFLDPHLFWLALDGGHIPVVDWLLESQCPQPPNLLLDAIETGHLHLVQWLHDEKHVEFPASGMRKEGFVLERVDPSLCAALRSGNLELVDWVFLAREKPMLCAYLFIEALSSRHLSMAQWLYDHECPWFNTIITRFCTHGSPRRAKKICDGLTPLFQWAWDHGPCELHPHCFYTTLLCSDKPAALWLLQHDCPVNWPSVRWDSINQEMCLWALEQKKRLGLPG